MSSWGRVGVWAGQQRERKRVGVVVGLVRYGGLGPACSYRSVCMQQYQGSRGAARAAAALVLLGAWGTL